MPLKAEQYKRNNKYFIYRYHRKNVCLFIEVMKITIKGLVCESLPSKTSISIIFL